MPNVLAVAWGWGKKTRNDLFCSHNIAKAVFPLSASRVPEGWRITTHQGAAIYSAIPCERIRQASHRRDWELACTLSTAEWRLKPLSCCKNNPNLIGRKRHHPSNYISKGVSACNPILCRGWFHKYVLRQPATSRPPNKIKRGLGWGCVLLGSELVNPL